MADLSLYLLFRETPTFDLPAVARAIGEPARVSGIPKLFEIEEEDHKLRGLVVDGPLPREEIERCLPVAHLRPDQKEELASQRGHAILWYENGPRGGAGLVALHGAAAALGASADGFLGVIGAETRMALPADMLDETLSDEFIEEVLEAPASSLGLWLGFIKMFKPDGTVWLVTRGGPFIGAPDFAFLAPSVNESSRVMTMFTSIMNYAHRSHATLAAGHTLDLGAQALQLRAPYEYVEQLGEATLVLEAR
jgi:hypothetical protein